MRDANIPSDLYWEPLDPSNPTASKKNEVEGFRANDLVAVMLLSNKLSYTEFLGGIAWMMEL